MEALLGQHRGLLANALANVMPRAASCLRTMGIPSRESHRWSSVRMNTMLGRLELTGARVHPTIAEARTTTAARTTSERAGRNGRPDIGIRLPRRFGLGAIDPPPTPMPPER